MGLRNYDPDYYHEISQRTNQGTFVMDPNNDELREAFYGVLAYASWYYGVQVLAFHFMSNHYHGLYAIECPRQFNMFLSSLHAGFARAYHRIHGTCNKFWSYMTWNPVAKDEASVSLRLKYIMGQATAAGNVNHPDEFQGASSLDWMLHGKTLQGVVFKATQKCRDSKRLAAGAKPEQAYRTRYDLVVHAPAVWAHLSPQEMRKRYWSIADELAGDAKKAREKAEQERQEKLEALRQQAEQLAAEANAASQDAEPQPADPPGAVGDPLGALGDEPELPPPYPKSQAPMPTGEDGEPLRKGKVKPKLRNGAFGRARRPKLLAADREVVQAYEDRYAQACEAYREAKEQWRREAKVHDRALASAQIALPANMLLGTLPQRLPGDRQPPKAE